MRLFFRRIYSIFLIGLSLIVAGGPASSFAQSGSAPVTSAGFTLQSFAKRPLSFEANQGQLPAPIKFRARGDHYSILLSSGEAMIALQPSVSGQKYTIEGTRLGDGLMPVLGAGLQPAEHAIAKPAPPVMVRMTLLGGNAAAPMAGVEKCSGHSNYFIGDDSRNWHTEVANFAKVRYGTVYPGVDLLYYGNQERLEFDFEIAPHADSRAILMNFEGAGSVQVNAAGELLLKTGSGQLALHQPEIYQVTKGRRNPIAGRYRLRGPNQVGFEIGAYDRRRLLVIDPVLIYSTYLGGKADENSTGIAVDSAGNAYVAGVTSSSDFPVTAGASQPRCGTDGLCNGRSDFFVAKYSPAGALLYSTFIGGSGNEFVGANPGHNIAVDGSGNAYITGNTQSGDYPTTPGAFSTVNTMNSGSLAGVVTKLNPTGSALVYSTYLNNAALMGAQQTKDSSTRQVQEDPPLIPAPAGNAIHSTATRKSQRIDAVPGRQP